MKVLGYADPKKRTLAIHRTIGISYYGANTVTARRAMAALSREDRERIRSRTPAEVAHLIDNRPERKDAALAIAGQGLALQDLYDWWRAQGGDIPEEPRQ